MIWIDEDSYVGPCRRVARRPHLHDRRGVNCAQLAPPDLRRLLYVLASAPNDTARPRMELQLQAGLDLAQRIGDAPMEQAYRAVLAGLRNA